MATGQARPIPTTPTPRASLSFLLAVAVSEHCSRHIYLQTSQEIEALEVTDAN